VGPDRHATALETIDRTAKAQAQLVEDLLDLSRIVGGQARLNVQAVNVADVVAEPWRRCGPRPMRLTPSNSRNKAGTSKSEGAGELPRVDIVADEGEGIPVAFLPHVFDRFRQADSRNVLTTILEGYAPGSRPCQLQLARRVDRLRALDSGFQMHVAKPVEPAELVATIRAVLSPGPTRPVRIEGRRAGIEKRRAGDSNPDGLSPGGFQVRLLSFRWCPRASIFRAISSNFGIGRPARWGSCPLFRGNPVTNW
jgi:hypothetical protein